MISGMYLPPIPPLLSRAGETVADPKVIADVFADHFVSVSRKDSNLPMALHRRHLDSRGVNFASSGGR